jgi:cell wall-associated NlpC family hydrolase
MALPSGGIPGQPGSRVTADQTVNADPVMLKIAQEQSAVEALAERLNEAGERLVQASTKRAETSVALDKASEILAEKQREVDEWARSTYIDAATHPSGLPIAPRLPGLGLLPGTRIVDTPLSRLAEAQEAYDEAAKADAEAADAEAKLQREVDGLRLQLDNRGTALNALRTQHAATIAAAEQRRNQQNDAISAAYLRDGAGAAGSAAQQAVRYALAQLGKPYVWAAEGPNAFDCSGLVQAAYGSAGVALPRTARPQYRATTPVAISTLLPGDLLFFATNKSDWNTIHHVAIYIGKGKMVHAPTFGDVVKVSPIWWAEFFAATRVVKGSTATVPPPATPTKPTTPTPTPGPKPTVSPKPSPTGSPSPSPTKPPSPTPSPSPTKPPSPAPTPSPTCSPSPSPSPSPSSSGDSPSSTPSTTTSPSASPSTDTSGGGGASC